MIEGKKKVNLSKIAYEQIKDALCEGRILAGDILNESRLAEDMRIWA